MNVDVVIVTYRSAECIAACIDSLPHGAEVSITVVDNASGDDAPNIARALGCTVVENADNRGFAAAANQGARLGSSEAILFLNPDARLLAGAFDALIRPLDEPDVAIVGAALLNPDRSVQRSRWPYPSPRGMWAEALGLHRRRRPSHGDAGFVVGACFLVRRSVFEACGGFDDRYWLYGEEADLCFRVERAGGRIVSSSAQVEHEGGASGRDASDLVADHFTRGSDRFVLDHFGRASLVSYRLAGLTAAALRYPLLRISPIGRARANIRAGQMKRTARSLIRRPLSVSQHRRREVAPEIILLSLEPWDEVWRRNQFLVRELLQLQPDLRVLWVEPPSDPLHELVRSHRMPQIGKRALRRLPSDPPRDAFPTPQAPATRGVPVGGRVALWAGAPGHATGRVRACRALGERQHVPPSGEVFPGANGVRHHRRLARRVRSATSAQAARTS